MPRRLRYPAWGLVLAAVSWTASGGESPPATPQRTAAVPKMDTGPALKFKQLQNQALGMKSPGGRPPADSSALFAQLKTKYAGNVETQNARLRTRIPPQPGGPGGGATLGQSQGGGPGAMSKSQLQMKVIDPCPNTVELKAWQGTPPVDPGEYVVLDGCGFGILATGAEARLVGDFPGGYLKLNISSWSPTRIIAILPMVTGVGDMPAARLQVIHSSSRFSNMLDVGGFRATREVRLIHPIDVAITCGHPTSSDDSNCTLAKSHPLSESNFFGGATFASKWSQSTTPKEDCDATDMLGGSYWGYTDLAAVNLHNGWVMAGYAWWWTYGGAGYVLPPEGFSVNSSSSTIRMNWGLLVQRCTGPYQSNLRYRVDLYAVGPKGVPYK